MANKDTKTINLALPKPRRPKRQPMVQGPESMQIKPVIHDRTLRDVHTAALLRKWVDPKYADAKFAISIPPDVALLLLEFYPPYVHSNGELRSIVGAVKLYSALLRLVDPSALIRVNNISNNNPFAKFNLPLSELLCAEPILEQIAVITDLGLALTGSAPSDQEIARALGKKDRSTIYKLRNSSKSKVKKPESEC